MGGGPSSLRLPPRQFMRCYSVVLMYISNSTRLPGGLHGGRESLDLNRKHVPVFLYFLCICRIFDGLRKESGLVQSIQFVTVPKTPKEKKNNGGVPLLLSTRGRALQQRSTPRITAAARGGMLFRWVSSENEKEEEERKEMKVERNTQRPSEEFFVREIPQCILARRATHKRTSRFFFLSSSVFTSQTSKYNRRT